MGKKFEEKGNCEYFRDQFPQKKKKNDENEKK